MQATYAVRPPAVAGSFYPADAGELRQLVRQCLPRPTAVRCRPKGLISPHAGIQYSGPIAGSGYGLLQPFAEEYRRVVLIGPSHHIAFAGLATSGVDAFETPLGCVAVDQAACDSVHTLTQVSELEIAHQSEHSLEVQLPFLQMILPDFTVVPIVVGFATTQDIVKVLDLLWGGPETLIVASSDLSHYQDYATAQRLDAATVKNFEAEQYESLTGDQACGFMGVSGLLAAAKKRGLHVTAVDVRNSGDTAGPRDHVVGYASCVVSETALDTKGDSQV